MKNIDVLRNMSVDELSKFLDENSALDGTTWLDWFESKYCSKCGQDAQDTQQESDEQDSTCPYCELHDKCKYIGDIPRTEAIVKMWLCEEKGISGGE